MGPRNGESASLNLWRCVISETSSDGEMHVDTVNKAGRDPGNETEIEARQALALFELVVMVNAKCRIVKNENARIVQEEDAPEI